MVVLDPVRQFPAGTGCEFDVTAHRIGRTAITDYSDGRETVDAHYIDYTIVNDANGKRFVTNFVHHEVDRYDAAANVYRGQSSGVSIYQSVVPSPSGCSTPTDCKGRLSDRSLGRRGARWPPGAVPLDELTERERDCAFQSCATCHATTVSIRCLDTDELSMTSRPADSKSVATPMSPFPGNRTLEG